MPFRFFNLAEAAEFLHLPEDRVAELARRGEIPCERQGTRLTFRHHALDEWASRNLLEASAEKLAEFHRRSTAKYHDLSDEAAMVPALMKPEWIRPAMTCRSKASVLREMVDMADGTGLLCYRDELLESLRGEQTESFDRTIDVLILRLRRKIEKNPACPQFIRTERGAGYLFCLE